MSDKNSIPSDSEESDVLERLQRLEDEIKEHDELQKRLKTISLAGILCILFFFTLFVYRLFDYARNYEVHVLMDKLRAESVEIIRPEMNLFVRQLQAEVIPVATKQVQSGYMNALPTLKQAALDLGQKLEVSIKERAEERLVQTMVNSLEKSSEQIKIIFPDFSPESLEKQIGQSMDYYVEQLHDSLEERLAMVSASLEILKSTAGQIGKGEELKHLVPTSVGEAEAQVIEGFIDLVIYEIKPELGDEPAESN